tara:strand:+ start:63 stop:680 length:618 start_codon:yes stop_codon:yes gene_type:complete
MSSTYYKIIFFLVALNLYANELPDYNSNDNWIELQSGIENIWVGYIEKPNINWVRTSSILPFKFEEVSKMIEKEENYSEIFKRVIISKEVLKDVIYMKIDMPFPFYDRDYLVEYSIVKEASSASYAFSAIEDERYPPLSSCVRLEKAAGEWYLEKIDGLSTRVSYTWNGDQGPSFPSYALTTAWKTQGSEMITDLEKSLQKLYKD